MYEKVKKLAERMVEKDSSLRIAFNEADGSRAPEPEAHEFLKLKETRLGRDFKLYGLMAKAGGEEQALVSVLEEVVLPLKTHAPAAFDAGLVFMKGQAPVFGKQAAEWLKLIESLKPTERKLVSPRNPIPPRSHF